MNYECTIAFINPLADIYVSMDMIYRISKIIKPQGSINVNKNFVITHNILYIIVSICGYLCIYNT